MGCATESDEAVVMRCMSTQAAVASSAFSIQQQEVSACFWADRIVHARSVYELKYFNIADNDAEDEE